MNFDSLPGDVPLTSLGSNYSPQCVSSCITHECRGRHPVGFVKSARLIWLLGPDHAHIGKAAHFGACNTKAQPHIQLYVGSKK